MKRYIPSEKVIERKYEKVIDANIKLVDEMRFLKDEKERLKEELENEKNAYNRMYNMYTEKEQEIERLNNIINKAIEYIEKADSETTDMYEMCEYSKNDLLSILRGEDKE